MTTLEAIAFFMDMDECTYGGSEPIQMAIEALKQEPREGEVILTKKEYGELVSSEFDNGYAKGYREALEQESVVDRDCENCSKKYGSLGCCDTVSNKWVYSCKEGQREYILDKIRAEIEQIEINGHIRDVECFRAGINAALNVIDKYKAGSEV